MKQLVIAGGGVSGLVFNYAMMARDGVQTTVLEPGKLGGEFLSGGLKYIHETEGMATMLTELDVPYSTYTVQGGILLKEKVEPFPTCFAKMEKDQADRIQADHFRKTRHVEPGDFGVKAMNDPASVKPRKALKCDFKAMVQALAAEAKIYKAGLVKVDETELQLSNGSKIPYDYLVMTLPLWVAKGMVPWEIPDGVASRLNVANVKPARDPYARWDYIYTPYTPADHIHRFSPNGGGYSVEVNGKLDRDKLEMDLSFIFKDGWTIESVREGLKGHLLPLDCEPKWPANVKPLGRFAKWDPRATTDETLKESMKLASEWFGG